MPLKRSGVVSGELKMLERLSAIDAHISEAEALVLYRQAAALEYNSRILEIGSFKGGSAVAMASAALERNHVIYCIDPWSTHKKEGVNTSENSFDMGIFAEFKMNTSFAGGAVRPLNGYSQDFKEILPDSFFDMIFIDGAHDYHSVKSDLLLSMRCLKKGGLLCGHDFHSMGEGVKKAVNELISSAPSIRKKGVFEGTFIWYAYVEDPQYEIKMAELVGTALCSPQDALWGIEQLIEEYGRLEELLMLQQELRKRSLELPF